MYRRLCIEKINILPDGTIPEVKMTSQGVGEPFALGEKIMGYMACEVHGGCYIDIDEKYQEVLTNFIADSEAVFRYVKSDVDFEKIKVTALGKGKVQLLMNGNNVGTVEVNSIDEYGIFEGAIESLAGEYELVIKSIDSKDLKIAEIILE